MNESIIFQQIDGDLFFSGGSDDEVEGETAWINGLIMPNMEQLMNELHEWHIFSTVCCLSDYTLLYALYSVFV